MMAQLDRDAPATRSQRWMLYILTKNNQWWDAELTVAEASREIAAAKAHQRGIKASAMSRMD